MRLLEKTEPTLSVIMPSYNNDRFISDAIVSVLAQPLHLELIIIDDCSTDQSRVIIRTWMLKDNRVKAIFHEKNLGIAKTFNDGIGTAKGKYLALISSDDMFKPDALVEIVRILDSRSDCAAAILNAECIDAENRRLSFLFSEWRKKPSLTEGNFFRYLVNGNFVCTGVIRRSAIEKTGIRFNEQLKYLNDWMFWLDLSHSNRFLYLEQPYYRYRIHGAAATANPTDFSTDAKIHDMILRKYGIELDRSTKSKVLRSMALDYYYLGSSEKARHCLHQSFQMNVRPLGKLMVLLLIILSYQGTLFRFFATLWRHRFPVRILVSRYRRLQRRKDID
jgi:teichuronic acid biosynthesis glycosyltransferase TuaG